MELLPHGTARLSGPRYDPPFDGLRELRLGGGEHHVHLDMARLTQAWYVLAPSVCYGYRPSFELRLAGQGPDPMGAFGLGLALHQPYAGDALRTDAAYRYFRRVVEHTASFPDVVSFRCDRTDAPAHTQRDWQRIESLLADIERTTMLPTSALRKALQQSAFAAAATAAA